MSVVLACKWTKQWDRPVPTDMRWHTNQAGCHRPETASKRLKGLFAYGLCTWPVVCTLARLDCRAGGPAMLPYWPRPRYLESDKPAVISQPFFHHATTCPRRLRLSLGLARASRCCGLSCIPITTVASGVSG